MYNVFLSSLINFSIPIMVIGNTIIAFVKYGCLTDANIEYVQNVYIRLPIMAGVCVFFL